MRQHTQWWSHLDEVFVKIHDKQHYLRSALDDEGEVLESYVVKRRDCQTALRFLKKEMKRYGNPEVIVTDCLSSSRVAMKVIENEDRQETARWANNCAENSHQSFRRREPSMLRFRQMRSLQKFASIHSSVHNHFNLDRYINCHKTFKTQRDDALVEWRVLLSA